MGWLRSVANIYHAFAVQCFTSELAHVARRDPVDFLLDLIGKPRIIDFTNVEYPNYGASLETYPWDTGRLRRVTEMVAEKSGWGKRKFSKGSGIGVAAHKSFLTYVATVVEVEVNDQGEVHIPRLDAALDAGLVVNPEATRAQFEGAIVHGTSIVRTGEITATNGAINQSNFQDYPVARINQVPGETNVYIVDSDEPPAGVGEPGVPPFVAAFCNAVYAATGKKVRNLPITNYGLS
jgi:isoquinoline 1-oxidoreductase beta subunit